MAKSYKYKRIRKTGSIQDLKRRIWQGINECERIILEEDHTDSQKIQAVHALNSSAKAYLKIIEVSELESRITALESKIEEKNYNGIT